MDTHDLADYWDEFKPANVRFAKNLSEPKAFRLDEETLARLRALAHQKGIGPTTLMRMWILERLADHERAEARPEEKAIGAPERRLQSESVRSHKL